MAVPSPELWSTLIRQPLVVSPTTTVLAAIAQMSGMDLDNSDSAANVQHSCVLVVDDGQVVAAVLILKYLYYFRWIDCHFHLNHSTQESGFQTK